ncbi:MAG: DNA polymerase III subunit beta [Candidatus Sumerlaeota bacterium]|nr:DNA polymerase III subunit beta [Candidatus Sumerlaeota bacterium]
MPITALHIQNSIRMAIDFGAKRIILFGSASENPDNARDLDIACEGVEGWKIFELAGKLEQYLQIPVDVVPLTPKNRFTEHIEKWGKVIYEQ